MNVGELIEELQKYNPRATVLLSSDAEGNSKGELSDVGDSWAYKGGYEWETLADEDLTDDEIEEADDAGDPYERVVVLWPI